MTDFDNSVLVGLLHRLDEILAAQDMPLSGLLRPGLTDQQIDDLMRPTGLTLPGELRTWWSWHDGARADGHFRSDEFMIGVPFFSLERAIETYHWWMTPENQPCNLDSILAEQWWRPTWFPISRGGRDTVYVDTAATRDDGTVALRYIDEPMWTWWDQDVTPSFTDYIALVIRLYDQHIIWGIPTGLNFDDPPPDIAALHIF